MSILKQLLSKKRKIKKHIIQSHQTLANLQAIKIARIEIQLKAPHLRIIRDEKHNQPR